MFGAGHGSESGGDAGVEDVSEEEEEDEETDLRGRDGEGDVCCEKAQLGDDEAGDDPDADLRKADGADSEDFAGHEFFGADGGEEDFEDAGGFFFDDGTRDVHSVEEDDEVHEEEERVDTGEGGVFVETDEIDGLEERFDFGGGHAEVAETLAGERGADSGAEKIWGEDVGFGFGDPFEGGASVWGWGRSDPDVAVELAVLEGVVEGGAGVGVGRRDDVNFADAVFAAFELGFEVAAKLGVAGDDGDVHVRAGTAVG